MVGGDTTAILVLSFLLAWVVFSINKGMLRNTTGEAVGWAIFWFFAGYAILAFLGF